GLTAEDSLEGLALVGGRSPVEVQGPEPRRARLVVAIAERQRDGQPGEIRPVHDALVDQPRQDAPADSVRGAAAGRAVDPAAGTDRVAVTRLKVGAPDPPAHRMLSTDAAPVRSIGPSIPDWVPAVTD